MAIPDTISYSEFRAHLASYLDAIENDSLPLVVKRKDGQRFVITTEEHYSSMDATTHLKSSPVNHKIQMKAIHSKKSARYASSAEAFKKLGI